MLDRRRFIVGAALIAAAVSYLVYAGIRSSSMYYFELDEFLGRRAALGDEPLRVKGWVRPGTMRWDARTNEGTLIESGVYVYQVESDGRKVAGTITVAK